MCGIHGIPRLDGAPVDPGALSAMGRLTAHRGPDDEGAHVDGPCAIGMRRLSIIDLAGGHQPLTSADGRIWLVCNGEIYNFRELRRELEGRGHRFSRIRIARSSSRSIASSGRRSSTGSTGCTASRCGMPIGAGC